MGCGPLGKGVRQKKTEEGGVPHLLMNPRQQLISLGQTGGSSDGLQPGLVKDGLAWGGVDRGKLGVGPIRLGRAQWNHPSEHVLNEGGPNQTFATG
ncbi:unnamed protein product [Linum trigynum]|uniref:Uncharacterized protein n=1 Tax=Linum trigynum TaxID=586398 RepID=A0AAV2GJP2_9ROSI